MSLDRVADVRGRERRDGLVVGVDRQRAVGRKHRLLLKLAVARVGFEQFFCRVLRLLHVRLVERVYAYAPAGKRRRDLPKEELFAEVVDVVERSIDYRVSGGFERLQLRLGLAVET